MILALASPANRLMLTLALVTVKADHDDDWAGQRAPGKSVIRLATGGLS